MDWKLYEFIKMEGDSGDGSGGGGEGGGEGGAGGGAGEVGGGSGESGGGAGGEDWRSGITDEHLRGAPALKDYTDITALAKSHVELQGHLGNAVRVPGPDASPEARQEFYKSVMEKAPNLMLRPDLDNDEDRDAFYQSLGRPESAEAYTIPEIEGSPNMKGAELFREVAFQNGLSQAQYENIVKGVTSANLKAAADAEVVIGQELVALKGEWGVKFDDNIKLATLVAERTEAPPELLAAVKANKASRATLEWLYSLAEKMGGGEGLNLTGDDGGPKPGQLTPAEAKARISEMLNNKQHPLWDPHHPEHADAVKRRLELQKMASPNASTDDKVFIHT